MILLTGPDHIGKRSWAEDVLSSLSGPDFMTVSDGIDSVREAVAFSATAPSSTGFRSILVDAADRLSEPAQDALLKLCEEPPGDLRVVLVSSDEGLLPPALLSRVRKTVRWSPLSWNEMLEFGSSVGADELALRMCYGRPGLFSSISSNPGFVGLHEAIISIGSMDPSATLVPDPIKSLKSGPSPIRDAICLVIEEAAKALVSSGRGPLAIPFFKLSSSLAKVPSLNAEIHWFRACLEASL
jgi:hypothetical protein